MARLWSVTLFRVSDFGGLDFRGGVIFNLTLYKFIMGLQDKKIFIISSARYIILKKNHKEWNSKKDTCNQIVHTILMVLMLYDVFIILQSLQEQVFQILSEVFINQKVVSIEF